MRATKYEDIFLSRIDEIRKCLSADLYLAALSLALTLPDICGKAEFPSAYSKVRYLKWFDTYMEDYRKSESPYAEDMPFLSGEIVYQLRCNFLHIGNPNIDRDKIDVLENKIDRFELVLETESSGDTSGVAYGNGTIVCRSYRVDVKLLCYRLCRVAEQYYNDNKEKFDFFRYSIFKSDINLF